MASKFSKAAKPKLTKAKKPKKPHPYRDRAVIQEIRAYYGK